jgi:hypothetical protein
LIHERLGDLLRGLGSPEFRQEYRIALGKAYEKSDKNRLKAKLKDGPVIQDQVISSGKSSCYP